MTRGFSEDIPDDFAERYCAKVLSSTLGTSFVRKGDKAATVPLKQRISLEYGRRRKKKLRKENEDAE